MHRDYVSRSKSLDFCFPFAGNAMACVELTHLGKILNAMTKSDSIPASAKSRLESLTTSSQKVQAELCSALQNVVTETVARQSPLPYEVDGGDGKYFMDDANVPSLLSLPLLGYMSSSNAVYLPTRSFVLSEGNPFYFQGCLQFLFLFAILIVPNK